MGTGKDWDDKVNKVHSIPPPTSRIETLYMLTKQVTESSECTYLASWYHKPSREEIELAVPNLGKVHYDTLAWADGSVTECWGSSYWVDILEAGDFIELYSEGKWI